MTKIDAKKTHLLFADHPLNQSVDQRRNQKNGRKGNHKSKRPGLKPDHHDAIDQTHIKDTDHKRHDARHQ